MSAQTSVWDAPCASQPIRGCLTIPGSKSLTNRELLLASLAEAPSTLKYALWSRDTALMVDALRALGNQIEVEFLESDPEACAHLTVIPAPRHEGATDSFKRPNSRKIIDCGLSGTVMRFLPPLAYVLGIDADFRGDPQAYLRPQHALISGLRQLGAKITESGEVGFLPFSLESTAQTNTCSPASTSDPLHMTIDAGASSQFISAFLMVGARLKNGLLLNATGHVPSKAHIEMTIAVLRAHGVQVSTQNTTDGSCWRVEPGPVTAIETNIEPDLSNAGPFLAAAAVTGGEVTITGWPAETTQAGAAWETILPQMGVKTKKADGSFTVIGPRGGSQNLNPIDIDLADWGELTPTLAAICALIPGLSRIRGIGHLRGHETDRLQAIATEITRLGGKITAGDDFLEFHRPINAGGVVESYHDHRMATFGAILGLRQRGIWVRDIETTSKTLPNFLQMWASLEGIQ